MSILARPGFRLSGSVLVAFALLACPAAALAGERADFLYAPADAVSPIPKLAAQFQLELQLPEGKGLARALLDAGVNQDDASAAARLAAGHLGADGNGCSAKVSIERGAGLKGFNLMRVQLVTETGSTVIERRGRELTVSSETSARRSPPIV